jgi:putative methyltransferase (TIGR04325 family)
MFKVLCPPVVAQIIRKVKHKKVFFGVYKAFEEVPAENLWAHEGWINESRKKLDDLLENSQKNMGLFPGTVIEGYTVLPCLVINMLSGQGECRVLDFAGGTGLIYYRIRPYLAKPGNVLWDVVDSNDVLLEMGRKSKLKDDSVQFLDRLPPPLI